MSERPSPPVGRSPRRSVPGVAVGLALVAASVLGAGSGVPAARAEDAPAPAAPAAPKSRALTDKERADLVAALRVYLDAESPDGYRHRLGLIEVVKKLKESGADVLADVEGLRALVYQARGYVSPWEKKPKDAGKDYEVRVDSGSGAMSVKADVRVSVAAPPSFLQAREQKKLGGYAPLPTILVLHSAEDFEDRKATKPWPGEEAIKRLYPKATMKALLDAALVVAPVQPKGNFLEEDAVRPDKIPLPAIWRRYALDFNRIVIDGGREALLYAAAYPTFYAGVVVRGDTADLPPEVVPNLSSSYVYVVQTTPDKVAPAFATLEKGGHPAAQLKAGPPTAIGEWLAGVRRVPPKTFRWAVKDKSAHRLAHWVNLDEIDEAEALPTLEATVVDTKEDPNTVKIRTTGVRRISIFLNDELVDLGREVRVVVNGKVVNECRIETNKPDGAVVRLPAKFARTVDGMFDRRSVPIRKSMFYGWLYPVCLEQIDIEGNAPPEEVVDPNAAGASSEEQAEAAAKVFFEKAQEQEKAGNLQKAKALYEKACGVGDTSWRPKARERIQDLETKLPPTPEGAGMGAVLAPVR